MDYTVRGILQARILVSGSHSLPRDLPNPGIKPRSPTLQADSLPAEPSGKPREAEVKDLKEWRIYLSPRYFLPEIWSKTSMFIRNSRSLKWLENYQRCKGSINSLVTKYRHLSFILDHMLFSRWFHTFTEVGLRDTQLWRVKAPGGSYCHCSGMRIRAMESVGWWPWGQEKGSDTRKQGKTKTSESGNWF